MSKPSGRGIFASGKIAESASVRHVEVTTQLSPDACENCQDLMHRAGFSGIHTGLRTSGSPTAVHHVFDRLETDTCNFCRILSIAARRLLRPLDVKGENRENQQHSILYLRCYDSLVFSEGFSFSNMRSIGRSGDQCSTAVAVVRGSTPPTRKMLIRGVPFNRGAILPVNNIDAPLWTSSSNCIVRKGSTRTEIARIRSMIANCGDRHSACGALDNDKNNSGEFPIAARVIDCDTQEIVPLTQETPYIALSYVWGDPRCWRGFEPQYSIARLPRHLPRTITDAMLVVKKLHLKYLWVDRCCIAQDQSEDSLHQVKQMSKIFSQAFMTLCPLTDSVDEGFPGVSSDLRKQLSVRFENLEYSWTGPNPRQRIMSSKWGSRGWTYQELVLSRRCLFFTTMEAVLLCRSGATYENLEFKSLEQRPAVGQSLLCTASDFPLTDPWAQFSHHHLQYDSRELTFPSDRLHAFKGILSQLDCQSYWGIPIWKSHRISDGEPTNRSEAGFLVGLTWRTTSVEAVNMSYFPKFPSWSWTARKRASYSDTVAQWHDLTSCQTSRTIFQPIVSIKLLDGSWTRLEDFCLKMDVSKLVPEQTRYLRLETVLARWEADGEILESRAMRIRRMEVLGMHRTTSLWGSAVRYKLMCDDATVAVGNLGSNEHTWSPTNGYAILLCMIEIDHGFVASWLAVDKMSDGTFARCGLIVDKFDGTSALPGMTPPPS